MVQGECQRFQSLFSDRPFQLAFPHSDAMPSHGSQLMLFFFVAAFVAFYFRFPESDVRLGQGKILASFMSMPETAVDENGRTVFP